jgi:hypothetical protein
MGGRLNLPGGWRCKSTMRDRDLVIETKGLANIVRDVLSNMYQGCLHLRPLVIVHCLTPR